MIKSSLLRNNGIVSSKYEKQNGITLISLIITVIVLLILAGITLQLTLGDRGIFGLAKMASKNYINAQEEELASLDNFSNKIDNMINIVNVDETKVEPNNKHEIIYIGKLNKITGNNGVVT